jgi:uncharacterized repeat protein (TIGR03803 family)
MQFPTLVLAVLAMFAILPAHARQFRVIHTFAGAPDGAGPNCLIQDANGVLYGTTYSGGAYGYGTIFKINAVGQETILYSFQGGADGGGPQGIVLDTYNTM